MIGKWAWLCLGFALGSTATTAHAQRARATPTLSGKLDAYLQPLTQAQEFSGVILIQRGRETLAERAYGFASRELQVPNTRSTRFLIGSISKQFTAAAILLLEQRGQPFDVSVNELAVSSS